MTSRQRLVNLLTFGVAALVSLGLLLGFNSAKAGAAPVAHKAVKCATYYIEVPDVNPPPVHLSGDAQPLIFFRFCGTTVVPGAYTCPVKSGQQLADKPVNCKRRK